jgi:hypothetical protein
MAGKIFYRERLNAKEGAKTPRYRVIAVSGVDLKIYADHLRMVELEQIAQTINAELVHLKRGPKHLDTRAEADVELGA